MPLALGAGESYSFLLNGRFALHCPDLHADNSQFPPKVMIDIPPYGGTTSTAVIFLTIGSGWPTHLPFPPRFRCFGDVIVAPTFRYLKVVFLDKIIQKW